MNLLLVSELGNALLSSASSAMPGGKSFGNCVELFNSGSDTRTQARVSSAAQAAAARKTEVER